MRGNKLSEEIIIGVVTDYKNNNSVGYISEKYKIHKNTIYSILKNKDIKERNHKISEYIVNKIIEDYNNSIPIKDISMKYNVHLNSVHRVLKRNNIKRNRLRRHNINENFFDSIDSQEKAYFLGFLFADGNNNRKKGTISIGLKYTDRDILEVLKNLIYNSQKELLYIDGCSKKGPRNTIINSKPQYRLVIFSTHMCRTLEELGCTSRKTYKATISQVILDSKFFKHFLRGFFDGDGHIGLSKKSSRSDRLYGQISICGLENILLLLQEKIVKEIPGIESVIIDSYNNKVVKDYRIVKKDDIAKFLDWIYEDATILLKRKYDTYLELKRWEKIPLKKRTTNKVCILCGGKHKAKGYCKRHYERIVKYPKIKARKLKRAFQI